MSPIVGMYWLYLEMRLLALELTLGSILLAYSHLSIAGHVTTWLSQPVPGPHRGPLDAYRLPINIYGSPQFFLNEAAFNANARALEAAVEAGLPHEPHEQRDIVNISGANLQHGRTDGGIPLRIAHRSTAAQKLDSRAPNLNRLRMFTLLILENIVTL